MLAAILVVSNANGAESQTGKIPEDGKIVLDLLDIANSDVFGVQHYTWSSVQSGPGETHYKSYELFVSRPLH